MNDRGRLVILGAGPTGLGAAFRLRARIRLCHAPRGRGDGSGRRRRAKPRAATVPGRRGGRARGVR